MFKMFKLYPKLCLLGIAAISLLIGLVRYWHWDERLLFLWQERGVSLQQQADSVWLPGYRAVIQAKPLEGLEESETSGLSWSPLSNTLFTVTGKIPKLR